MIEKHSKRVVRQDCVLGSFLVCLIIEPVYRRLTKVMGLEGALYSYSDDAYVLVKPKLMAATLSEAPALYNKIGLR